MLTKHEVPTHLEVPDKIVFGLTLRQLLVLGGAIALGYTCWEHLGQPGHGKLTHASLASPIPWPLRLLVALVPCLLALVIAFARYRGRWAEEWLLASLHYAVVPKAAVWRPCLDLAMTSDDVGELPGRYPPLIGWGDGSTGDGARPAELTEELADLWGDDVANDLPPLIVDGVARPAPL